MNDNIKQYKTDNHNDKQKWQITNDGEHSNDAHYNIE